MVEGSAAGTEQLRELNKQLSKAAADSRIDDILSVLRQLKAVSEPTEEMIRVRVLRQKKAVFRTRLTLDRRVRSA